MRTGEELKLSAMRREFSRLSKVADKAKKEADEVATIGSEFVAIHEELSKIVSSGLTGDAIINQLDTLKKRQARADRIVKKDLVSLLDREHHAIFERDLLGREIQNMEFAMEMRRAS